MLAVDGFIMFVESMHRMLRIHRARKPGRLERATHQIGNAATDESLDGLIWQLIRAQFCEQTVRCLNDVRCRIDQSAIQIEQNSFSVCSDTALHHTFTISKTLLVRISAVNPICRYSCS